MECAQRAGPGLQSLQAGTSSDPTSLQNLSYTYDAVGNVASITDAGESTSFTYDTLDRLTGTSGPYSQSYEYSGSDGKIGNLTFKTGVGSYTYGASVSGCSAGTPATKPHAVAQAGSDGFGYDCNANMTGHAGHTLAYDAENRLRSVTTAGETITFTHDGDGRRALRDTATETIAYAGPHYEARFTKTDKPEDLDGDCVVTVIDIMRVARRWGQAGGPEDLNGGGTVDVGDIQQVAGQWRETCHVLAGTTKYYSLGGRRVAMRKAGTLYYLFTDHLGSTSVTYNTTNSQPQTLRYYPWGGIRSGDVPTDRRFTGQRWDATIALYDYQARFYDPALGRFIQPDTIVPEPGNPQDLNRYTYAGNNPLIYTDPLGHCPWCITIGGGALIGGGISYGTQVAANISQNGLTVQAFTDVNWATVGAGAVAGAVGGATFGVGTAVIGTGLVGMVASGAVSGAAAGQAARATENVLSGEAITAGLGDPAEIVTDAAIGGTLAGVGRTVDIALIKARLPGFHSRYVLEGELEAIQETGLLRGGRPGKTCFSTDTYETSKEATSRLSLKVPPEYRVELEILNHPSIQGPQRVQPWIRP